LQGFSGFARFAKSLCNLDTKNDEKLGEICKKCAFFALSCTKLGKNGAIFALLGIFCAQFAPATRPRRVNFFGGEQSLKIGRIVKVGDLNEDWFPAFAGINWFDRVGKVGYHFRQSDFIRIQYFAFRICNL
jgi:hypothetical protein